MARKSKYTKELLSPIVAESLSWAQVLTRLGLNATGGNYRHIQARVRGHEICTAHFTGKLWSVGHTKDSHESIRRMSEALQYKPEDVFIENAGHVQAKVLRKLMLLDGFEYICTNGHKPVWMGQPLTLHVDHINGVHDDNRRENLRFLCPNCHQQTKTWGKAKGDGALGETRTLTPEGNGT